MQGFVHSLTGRAVAVLAFAASLAACGPKVDKTAAADVVVFLNAARTDNRTAFEARIDRAAVRDDLRAQLGDLPGVKELQSQLGEGMAEGALDRMVTPAVVRRLEKPVEGSAAATMDDIRPRLRSAGSGRICLRDPKAKDTCLLTFAKVDTAWKLVGLQAERQSFEPPGGVAVAAVAADSAD